MNWPDQSAARVRDALDEVSALRQELADTKADLKRTVDRAEGLAANLHRNTEQIGRLQRENAELESTLKSTQEMVVRSDRARIAAEEERDRLRTAIKHVADLATQGNTVGLIAAAARLGEVLDGGT